MKTLLVALFVLGVFINQLYSAGFISPVACKIVIPIVENSTLEDNVRRGSIFKAAKINFIYAICKMS